MTHDQILNNVKSDYFKLCKNSGHDVLGVFLFGSQNYNVDTQFSDIDTKAILIPTVDEMIFGRTRTSEIVCKSDGAISVFDINSMHVNLKKQNINFLEILFTDYFVLNPKYKELWQVMQEHAEEISHMNEYAAVECINGCIINKLKKIFHSVPSNEAAIQKYGYDNKAVADVLRLSEFMERYISGESYMRCLIPTDTRKLVDIKTNPHYNINEVKELIKDVTSKVDLMLSSYKNTHKEIVNYDTLQFIDNVTKNCCQLYIKERSLADTTWPSL